MTDDEVLAAAEAARTGITLAQNELAVLKAKTPPKSRGTDYFEQVGYLRSQLLHYEQELAGLRARERAINIERHR